MKPKKKPLLNLPLYRLNLSSVFPELPPVVQYTGDAQRPVASLVLFAAFLMSGHKPALCEDVPLDDLLKELEDSCKYNGVELSNVVAWAESLLIAPDAKPSAEVLEAVPRFIEGKGWGLKNYQIETAAWCAMRHGSVAAWDPGAGKTALATAAAIAAKRLGTCNDSRCYIYAPAIAMSEWIPYCVDLDKHFKEVRIISIDSASNHANMALDRTLGGGVIIDELHKMKADDSNRGDAIEHLRHRFQWGIGLSGTLLNTGIEGIVRSQDIALPGLSRFTDLWSFGRAFDAIYEKEFETGSGRKMRKHSVGLPPPDMEAAFNVYLSRGVRSLSFDSPEIRAEVDIKVQDVLRIDDWQMPDWAKELQGQLNKLDSRNQVFWGPDWRGKSGFAEYMGATALAMMKEMPDGELPSAPKVIQELCKDGRYNRVAVREYSNGIPIYRFEYAPGATVNVAEPWTIPYGCKIQYVLDWLDTNKDKPLVIGAVGTNSCLMMATGLEKYGYSYHLIDGRTKHRDRGKYKDEFQDGKVRVMLMQQAAGAESITLTRSNTSMLIDHNWSANTYKQFTRRTYRITSTEDCAHYDLQFNSIQKTVIDRLVKGQAFDSAVRREIEKGFWENGIIKQGI